MEQYEVNWKDYYAALGVGPGAEPEVVKAACTALARKHHPDAGGSVLRMQEINEAWEVLSEPQRKARYDSCLRQRRSSQGTERSGREWQPPSAPSPRRAQASGAGVLPWPSLVWQRVALFCSIPLGVLLVWCSFDIWATVAGLVVVAVAVFAAVATRGLSRVEGGWTAARVAPVSASRPHCAF